MRRVAIVAVIGVAALAGLAVVGDCWMSVRWRSALREHGEDAFLDMPEKAVEQQIRRSLPVGSSIETVQTVLQYGRFESAYDAKTKTLNAVARNVKESNWLIQDDLGLSFHFDSASKLTGIETKRHLTGP
jgi:hypothetical protein